MSDSYPFTTYSGLFEPKHYKRIGTALWFFLWCVSSTTDEEEVEGIRWGNVLRNKPLRLSEIGAIFGVDDKTVSRWIKSLEEQDYIQVTRAPYGLIIKVKNSKKFIKRTDKNVHSPPEERSDKNVRSEDREQTNLSDLSTTDQTKMSDLPDKNVRSNKDIIKILNNTAITTTEPSSEIENSTDEIKVLFNQLMNTFCEIHDKQDYQINAIDRDLMHRIIALGVGVPLITKVMRQVYQDRTGKGRRIHSFSYYRDAIMEAWENEQAQTTPAPAQGRDVARGTTRQNAGPLGHGAAVSGVPSVDETQAFLERKKAMIRKQQEELERKRRAEEQHGQRTADRLTL